jgi:hypothetical protein
MRSVCILAALVLVSVCPAAKAQDSGYQGIVQEFFTLLRDGHPVEAVEGLYGTNPWIARSRDAVETVKSSLLGLEDLVGRYRGHEALVETSLGDRLVYLSYLVVYDRQPLRFEFTFYRPEDRWMTYAFSFDDDIDEDLKQMGRNTAFESTE